MRFEESVSVEEHDGTPKNVASNPASAAARARRVPAWKLRGPTQILVMLCLLPVRSPCLALACQASHAAGLEGSLPRRSRITPCASCDGAESPFFADEGHVTFWPHGGGCAPR